MGGNPGEVSKWDWLFRQIEQKASIINGISDALMLLDAKAYKIIDVNRAFLNLYKVSHEQVIGKTCYEITHHLSKPCSQIFDGEPCPLKETESTGKVLNAEYVHRDRNGNLLYFEIISFPLTDTDGEVNHILHLSREVTERRRAEEALKARVQRSEHLAALGQIVAEIIHEIKNPLMMIGGFAQQLFRVKDEDTKTQKLTIITDEVKRLEKLLADLRQFYIPKAPSTEVVNIKDVLEKVYSLVKDECDKKRISTELKINEKALLVHWDSNKLEQVFLNVIKNSIESMENGGKLVIQHKLLGDKVQISIEDNGCGISKENMDKIIDCFFTTKSYGTGLGLCIIKKFIDDHDGSSLSVRSKEGKGTSVNVTLPLYTGNNGQA